MTFLSDLRKDKDSERPTVTAQVAEDSFTRTPVHAPAAVSLRLERKDREETTYSRIWSCMMVV